MIILLLLLVFCIGYFLYIKSRRYLSFGSICLFFLWYWFNTSLPIFTFTHIPLVITSSHQHNSSPEVLIWPINIIANYTRIEETDLQRILSNKNLITVTDCPGKENVLIWNLSMNASGLWSDVDYSSGCSARKANWPARRHLERIESMASLWYSQQDDDNLLSNILQGLDYWFMHDFTQSDCVLYGGDPHKSCPCGTLGLWNLTWYSQVIAIPRHIGNICLLLLERLSPMQKAQCIKFTSRSYSVVNLYNGPNLANVAYNGISLALLKQDPLILQDALERTAQDAVFASSSHHDGIQVDGSYLFHDEQLYNGNYGEDHTVALLAMFDIMRDSSLVWFPANTTLNSFKTLVLGSEWMMVGYSKNTSTLTSSLRSPWLWQYSVLSRMISFKTTDQQGTAGILLDVSQLGRVTKSWLQMATSNTAAANTTLPTSHDIINTVMELESIVARLNRTYSPSTPHGPLIGTRYFWNADYLVHRCHGFVTTLKMVSARTTTSECTNGQNIKGYHLNDGSLFTYQHGLEYLDTFGAWGWNNIPGTTTKTALSPDSSLTCGPRRRYYGKEAFVGAAVLQQGQLAVAVMNYTDPQQNDDGTGSLGSAWRKTYFFFPSLYAVQLDTSVIGNVTANNIDDSSFATYTTTLDQRRRYGDVYINGRRTQHPNGNHPYVTTLWHDKTLYSFESPVNLTLDASNHTSDWSSIGVSQGNESVDIWSATVITAVARTHQAPSLTYTVQPNYGLERHQIKSPLEFISAEHVRGAFSPSDHALTLAFWAPGSIRVPWSHTDDDGDDGVDVVIESIHPLTMCLQQQVENGTWVVSISDPTQSLDSTTIKISVDQEPPTQYDIDFLKDTMRGSSVILVLQDEP